MQKVDRMKTSTRAEGESLDAARGLLAIGLAAMLAGCGGSSSDSTPGAVAASEDASAESGAGEPVVADDGVTPDAVVSGTIAGGELQGRWEMCRSDDFAEGSSGIVWKFDGDRFEECFLLYDSADCSGNPDRSEALSCLNVGRFEIGESVTTDSGAQARELDFVHNVDIPGAEVFTTYGLFLLSSPTELVFSEESFNEDLRPTALEFDERFIKTR